MAVLAPAPGTETIRIGESVMWLHDDVVCEILGRNVIAEFDLFIQSLVLLTGGRRLPLLVDGRGLRFVAPDMRRRGLFHPQLVQHVSALGIVAGPITRMIAAFALRAIEPPLPIRLFDDVPEARAWCRSFLEQETPAP